MPTAERYTRYREDQTTIWVSKTAAEALSRERQTPGEGASAVLDRLLAELKKLRRSAGVSAPSAKAPAKSAAKAPAKGAAKSAARGTKAAKKAPAKKAARR